MKSKPESKLEASRESAPEFKPGQRKVRTKYGGSCGYKDGWYVLDLKGTNYQISYDHGVMLAEEIRAYIEETRTHVWVCMGVDYDYARADVQRLADGKLSPEIAEELKAIAAGVTFLKPAVTPM
ncbi:MAG: hypothetical protein LBC35_03140 [Coriobacteriales bacterium]|jgi:hypothetical protein|nr:hypothetical protein [Coriobacteriales bacterium]